jgi:uncharacterized membrane protein
VIRLTLVVTITAVGMLNTVLFWFMPRLTRHDLYFAVTVAPGFRDDSEGKSILRRYRTELILASALALAAVVAAVSWLGVGVIPGCFYMQVAASFIAFYRARQHVLSHAVPPTTIREAELGGGNRIIPGGWVVASGPFVLLAACAAYLWIHGEGIPARFAIHWGAGGQPNASVARGLVSVYFLSTAGILAALTLILYGMAHWVRSVHAGGPEGVRELKFRRTASAILLVWEYFITIQSSWIALVPRGHDLRVALLPFLLVFVLVAMVVLARLGQGGSRVPAANEGSPGPSAVPVGDRTQDKYWKLGIFYFNQDDSAVIVEHRFGLGYTLNFARSVTWVIVLLGLMGALVPVLAHRMHR